MPKDHYVAQTYLKHFTNSEGMLYAYRKKNASGFLCRPRDICTEIDGDIVPEFLSEPDYLKKFRSISESEWNHSLRALHSQTIGPKEKLSISMYWSTLLVCTPALRRVGVSRSNKALESVLKEIVDSKDRNGEPDKILEEALRDVNSGLIEFKTDPDFVRASYVKSLKKYTWILYNSEWTVLENKTELPFFTSDNPCSFNELGEGYTTRYLPLGPRLCLSIDINKEQENMLDEEPDYSKSPRKKVFGRDASAHLVEKINIRTAKCAENLLICGDANQYVENKVKKYANYRIESRIQTISLGGRSCVISSLSAVNRANRFAANEDIRGS